MPWMRSLAILLLLATMAAAGDWPQWLGKNRDASTDEVVAPWKGRLKVFWRQAVGEGHGSPVVADGVVYLHARDGATEAEVLQAFDGATGKRLWKSSYKRPPYKGLFGNGPRATPTVVGNRAYTFGITGILTCYDVTKKGKILWQIDTIKQFNAPKLFFGASCSPLVEGKKVLLNVGGKGASIVAFNAETGKVIWKTLDDKASYASPTIFGKGIERQAVFLTGNGLVAVSPRDGSVFWNYGFRDKLAESSTTPVRVGDMLIGSAITRGSVGMKLINTTAIPTAKKVWFNAKLNSYFATPVPVGKHLYMVTATKPPAILFSSTLRCIDPETGKVLWSRPNVGKYHASLLRTGDNKLLLLEEKGNLVLLDPSPKGYRELARSNICGNTWAHAAISNGKLYIRDAKELICVQLPIAKAKTALSPKRPQYQTRKLHDPNGTGKFYMGREIALVMGHLAAGWLERPEREQEEHSTRMHKMLQLKPGMAVADIGAGSGYHTFRMSKVVGAEGKVFAVDIQPQMLAIIKKRMKSMNVKNVVPVRGKIDDPKLPKNAIDLILMVDVYHEFSHPFEMTRAMIQSLKKGGRLVFVEFRLEDPKVPIKLVHKMSQRQVLKEMAVHPEMRYVRTLTSLPWQHVIVFAKK